MEFRELSSFEVLLFARLLFLLIECGTVVGIEFAFPLVGECKFISPPATHILGGHHHHHHQEDFLGKVLVRGLDEDGAAANMISPAREEVIIIK